MTPSSELRLHPLEDRLVYRRILAGLFTPLTIRQEQLGSYARPFDSGQFGQRLLELAG